MDQLDDRTSMSLGDRIILAARLAVAEHLGQSMAPAKPEKQIAIGGAGAKWIAGEAADVNRRIASAIAPSIGTHKSRVSRGDVG